MKLGVGQAGRVRVVGAVSLAVCVLLTAGCGQTADPTRAAASEGSAQKAMTEIPVAERKPPVNLSGKTTTGGLVDIKGWRGDPVVVNVWFAACGPCRAEAPDLAAVAKETEPRGVKFVGINVRDQADTAKAFEDTFKVPYPSIMDAEGQAIVGMAGQVNAQAVPTTVVLDRQGRVAGRIMGKADPKVLRWMIERVEQEPS